MLDRSKKDPTHKLTYTDEYLAHIYGGHKLSSWPGRPTRLQLLLICLAALFTLIRTSYLTGAEAVAWSAGNYPDGRGDTSVIAKLIGPGSINHTPEKWDVYGTDLGSMFLYHDKIYMVFGDTYGRPALPFVQRFHGDWRSNTMAWIADDNPRDGLTFAGMVTDWPGHAKELLSSRKIPGLEQTVIPTYGVSIDDRMYLFYMSVRRFNAPGYWGLNYSGVAYSDDAGRSWTKDMSATWPGDSNFGQVALVKQDGYLYLFGIPHGRFGGLQMARVPFDKVLDKAAYAYWDGSTWVKNNPAAARTIIPAPVGELSVRWNSYYHKWIMMYLNNVGNYIALRTSDCLTGPWSEEQVVTTAQRYPELYAPFITPKWNDGPDIYFTMSGYDPYSVYLMHTTLQDTSTGTGPLSRCVVGGSSQGAI